MDRASYTYNSCKGLQRTRDKINSHPLTIWWDPWLSLGTAQVDEELAELWEWTGLLHGQEYSAGMAPLVSEQWEKFTSTKFVPCGSWKHVDNTNTLWTRRRFEIVQLSWAGSMLSLQARSHGFHQKFPMISRFKLSKCQQSQLPASHIPTLSSTSSAVRCAQALDENGVRIPKLWGTLTEIRCFTSQRTWRS